MTDAVPSESGHTGALDARQKSVRGKVEVSWSYHPDRGLDMTLTGK